MKRRDMLKLTLAATAAGIATTAHAQQACTTDGTPAQFVPKKPADAKPLILHLRGNRMRYAQPLLDAAALSNSTSLASAITDVVAAAEHVRS